MRNNGSTHKPLPASAKNTEYLFTSLTFLNWAGTNRWHTTQPGNTVQKLTMYLKSGHGKTVEDYQHILKLYAG